MPKLVTTYFNYIDGKVGSYTDIDFLWHELALDYILMKSGIAYTI